MSKVVFIDVDGTLVPPSEIVPLSAVEAIETARKNGHKLYLCTGRSKPEIYQHILDVGFDGIIGAGGGYIESDNQVIMHKHVDMDLLARTLAFFNQYGIHHCVETNEGIYISEGYLEHIKGLVKQVSGVENHPFINALISGETLMREDVNKVCFMGNHDLPFKQIRALFDHDYEVHQSTVSIFGETSGEFAIKGVSKSNAIAVLLNHLGADQKDTVSLGDGDNDIDMFEYTHVSIAVAEGSPKLKAVADWISSGVEEDGLYHAFKYAGLI